ncbi:MAG: 50S ribosomal protein L29 [Patescibacteria group bacterium]
MIKLKELREKEFSELKKLLLKNREELAGLRSARALGKLADGRELRNKRGEIAQILTLLKEKEILAGIEEKKVPVPSKASAKKAK